MGKIIAGVITVGLGVVITFAVIDASKRGSLELGEPCEKQIHCKSGNCLVFATKSMCGQMCAQGCADGEECLALPQESKAASELADVAGEIFYCFPTKVADELGLRREPVVANAGVPEKSAAVEVSSEKPKDKPAAQTSKRVKVRQKKPKKPKGKFDNRHLLH
ncbi:MAG: hypothetical protein A2289_25020 [Deltaproteobacteria bacterium RIFOXYA12_FULL_58_15]|nr:MAG: hypothetical protein A2289_25020 [Deltaproteobacteria bacterium RIFOXYA12_FULL_58_15]OGR11012.1 MAG: hypothetical protein A2341_11540 [Deltaproteobacteria bacterium RIFOXYB12_FULL_58_9]